MLLSMRNAKAKKTGGWLVFELICNSTGVLLRLRRDYPG
jgi:hypothetical protein